MTLEWASGEDICPDELYYNSKNVDFARFELI
ncbi:hypothetical protein [Paradesulfitobacterium aromaticivorans]